MEDFQVLLQQGKRPEVVTPVLITRKKLDKLKINNVLGSITEVTGRTQSGKIGSSGEIQPRSACLQQKQLELELVRRLK